MWDKNPRKIPRLVSLSFRGGPLMEYADLRDNYVTCPSVFCRWEVALGDAVGRAPRSGRGGRRFKSCHSDQLIKHLAQPRKNRAQEIAQETYVLTSVIELAKRALLHCANHQSSMRPNWVRTRRQARQPAPSSAPRRWNQEHLCSNRFGLLD